MMKTTKTDIDPQIFDKTKQKITSILAGGDALIIIPPFFNATFISIGVYLLQSIAKREGFKIDILHLELLLADIIGAQDYEDILESPPYWMLGERMFARSAHNLPALGLDKEKAEDCLINVRDAPTSYLFVDDAQKYDLQKHEHIEKLCTQFMEVAAATVAELNYPVVGCSMSFYNQVNASVAFINKIKHYNPHCTTMLGGSYCEKEKAPAIFSLSDSIDYIFSGESEFTFIEFLQNIKSGKENTERLIVTSRKASLDKLPMADYQAYKHQVEIILGKEYFEHQIRAVWYESNRGCWWGEKSKCTFCGIPEVDFRRKKLATILDDLKEVQKQVPGKYLFFTDSIMPATFPDEILGTDLDLSVYPSLGMQIKVGRTLDEVAKLSEINARIVLPGVESFSTSLLKKMKKGTTGKQNIYFLRNAYSFGIDVQYFLLCGIPGDTKEEYESLRQLLPLIKHLKPPRAFSNAHILRDSPFFREPEEYNITKISHWNVYHNIFPEGTDMHNVAECFVGDFQSFAYENIGFIGEIDQQINHWREVFSNTHLHMAAFMGRYMIHDTRKIASETKETFVLTDEEAQEIMTFRPYYPNELLDWALANYLGVKMDGWYVPLVTASPELLLRFHQRADISQMTKAS